jgi:hypothetical protein
MASENSARWNMPILSNTTFEIWKMQILAHCMENNLDTYLLQDIAPPPATNAKKLEIYESWQRKAAGILVRCMGQDNNNKFVTNSNRQNPWKLWL